MAEEILKTLGQEGGVQKALNAVASAGQELLAGEPGSQEKLVARARELVYASESPQNQAAWSFWAQPARTAAARIAVDLKLFETAISDNERPKTATELAAPTGASPKLTERIARMCVSMQFLDQKGPDHYVPNKMTHTLAQPEWSGGIVFHYDIVQTAFAKLPEFLRKTNFQNPEDPKQGAWPYANGVDYPFTDMNPKDNLPAFQAFHAYIHGSRKHQPHWTEIYPVARLVEGLKPDGDSSAFIDVGGSMGSILQELQARNPEYTGRLILQERAHVVELAKSRGLGADGRIEAQAHDFFTEQPVKGARTYYMRSVLHDWPDHKCLEILSHLKAVMEPGYSKILLNEYVVKDENPDWRPLSLDLLMMTLVSAHERSESEWKDLIARSGLKIGGIFSKGEGCESVIELTL